MKVTQIYELTNTIANEMLGESVIVNEDLSNVVDVGKAIENLDRGFDNYVRKLVDRIGRTVFVDRIYKGRAPSVMKTGFEWGSIMEKISCALPKAQENESWELKDGTSYDEDIFTNPEITAKFFNSKTTFEVQMSITEKQVKSAFSNAQQLNAFYSMIETSIENRLTADMDGLVMRTINAGIGETLHNEFPGGQYSGVSGMKAVNLLALYNDTLPEGSTALDAEGAMRNADFIRFASLIIKNYMGRMKDLSNLFNIGGTTKFTPADRMKIVLLNDFKNSAEVYLYDGLNQFNTENIRLPQADTVAYWQGSGIDYGFDSISTINIKTPSGDTVNASGIIGVIFDADALGVVNLDRRTTSKYNAKAEFWNEWHKMDAGYFLDLNENFVVFYLA